jgi:hypothetical protein
MEIKMISKMRWKMSDERGINLMREGERGSKRMVKEEGKDGLK